LVVEGTGPIAGSGRLSPSIESDVDDVLRSRPSSMVH
jgi:hypothetical protein